MRLSLAFSSIPGLNFLPLPATGRGAMRILHRTLLCACLLGLMTGTALAQAVPLPGPADAGRINPEQRQIAPAQMQNMAPVGAGPAPLLPAPKAAETIHFVLKAVHFENVTVFKPDELRDLYQPYLNKDITLDMAYKMASALTARYRADGYFLSLAYVPAQHIKDGVITIRGVEGYVSSVELSDKQDNNDVIHSFSKRLEREKPLKSATIESFLLRLNDLPGYSFRAVLSPAADVREGAVKLTLIPAPTEGRGLVSFDNYSSRYLGPNELSLSYTKSLLPLQQTSISGLGAMPWDRLHYFTLDHAIVIAPDVTLDLSGNITRAHPGFTLTPFDIVSKSTFLSGGLMYQWIRQRDENLSLKASLDARDTTSDFLGTPFTRDHIRALRLNANYNRTDDWQGYNLANLTLSQGLDVTGASKSGATDISRAGATPDFTKVELSFSRLQGLPDDFSLLGAADTQWAPRPLYAAEEFGYGGQAFGRAYDASEITGDRGIAGSLELRYDDWFALKPVGVQPFTFYDLGRVWNEAVGQPPRESGSSAGFGIRLQAPYGFTGSSALAWPLTRAISVPIYGQSQTGPRIILQLSKSF